MSKQGFSGYVNVDFLADGRKVRVGRDVCYTDKFGVEWWARKGEICDGANIPRFFWRTV